jgi:hypothetical protein
MKIAIESPETLSDDDLEAIISVWNRKPRISHCYLEFEISQNQLCWLHGSLATWTPDFQGGGGKGGIALPPERNPNHGA